MTTLTLTAEVLSATELSQALDNTTLTCPKLCLELTEHAIYLLHNGQRLAMQPGQRVVCCEISYQFLAPAETAPVKPDLVQHVLATYFASEQAEPIDPPISATRAPIQEDALEFLAAGERQAPLLTALPRAPAKPAQTLNQYVNLALVENS